MKILFMSSEQTSTSSNLKLDESFYQESTTIEAKAVGYQPLQMEFILVA